MALIAPGASWWGLVFVLLPWARGPANVHAAFDINYAAFDMNYTALELSRAYDRWGKTGRVFPHRPPPGQGLKRA